MRFLQYKFASHQSYCCTSRGFFLSFILITVAISISIHWMLILYVTSSTDWKYNPFWRWDLKDLVAKNQSSLDYFDILLREKTSHETCSQVMIDGSWEVWLRLRVFNNYIRLYGIFKRYKESYHSRSNLSFLCLDGVKDIYFPND